MVTELLVAEGFAFSSTYPPDVKYQERFVAAQTSARNAARGLWGACLSAPVPPVVVQPTSPPSQGTNCHLPYQGACLMPNASDYDCAGEAAMGPSTQDQSALSDRTFTG